MSVLVDQVLEQLGGWRSNEQANAGGTADKIVTAVVKAMRRDTRFPRLPVLELELALADAQKEIEQILREMLVRHVHVDDVAYAVRNAEREHCGAHIDSTRCQRDLTSIAHRSAKIGYCARSQSFPKTHQDRIVSGKINEL